MIARAGGGDPTEPRLNTGGDSRVDFTGTPARVRLQEISAESERVVRDGDVLRGVARV